jgi:hypothetical protein
MESLTTASAGLRISRFFKPTAAGAADPVKYVTARALFFDMVDGFSGTERT